MKRNVEPMKHSIEISSLADLPAAARAVLERAAAGSVVAFYGAMGAGKTTLIKEMCAQMGVEDVVTSPTFALVNQYESSSGPVFHFDFYRIDKIEEAYDLGYEEYFYSGALCLVEWPEKIESLLPEGALRVTIETTSPTSRRLTME